MTKEEKIKHLCAEVISKGFQDAAEHIQCHFEHGKKCNNFADNITSLVFSANYRAAAVDSKFKKENKRVAGFYHRAAQILRGP